MQQKEKKQSFRNYVWKWKGSYTLEAVFVIPLVLGIIFAWMFELFYFHDRVVLDGIMQQNLMEKVGKIQEYSTVEIQKELEKKLWLLEISSLKEKESLGKCKYQMKVQVAWDIPVMREFLNGLLHFQKEWSCYSTQPDYLYRLRE